MQSISLRVRRDELQRALQTLSTNRRARFSRALPVWLNLNPTKVELQMVEERGHVAASIPAEGSWPPAGATISLFALKRAISAYLSEFIDLRVIADAIIFASPTGHVRLNLLRFGPEGSRLKSAKIDLRTLPLFAWAARNV
jgi:hypothetical protein